MRGGEKPWGRGKRTFCLGRVICFAEKGDKEVIADWRIQGWTPHPQRRRRDHTIKCCDFMALGWFFVRLLV